MTVPASEVERCTFALLRYGPLEAELAKDRQEVLLVCSVSKECARCLVEALADAFGAMLGCHPNLA